MNHSTPSIKSLLLLSCCILLLSCKKEDQGTCRDGQQNQNEFGIDCGGECKPCETCHDGIQNQNETDVDCGGECDPCPTCKDGTQNQNENGVDCGGPCPDCYTTPSCSIPTNSAEYANGNSIDSYSVSCQVTNGEYTIKGDGNSSTLKVHFDGSKPPKSHDIEVVSSGNQGLLERGECIIYLTISGEIFSANEGQTLHAKKETDGSFTVEFCDLDFESSSSQVMVSGHLDC